MKKKLFQNKRVFIVSLIILILLLSFIPQIINPLRRSEEGIEKYVLKKIPLGTSYDDVKEILIEEDILLVWESGWVNFNEREYRDEERTKCLEGGACSACGCIDCSNKSLSRNLKENIYLGDYLVFLPDGKFGDGEYGDEEMRIRADLIFDAKREQLIDVEITKNKAYL